MQFTTLLLLLAVALFLVLVLGVEESSAIFPYAIRGFVSDVRLNPSRFIGALFFKKAFLLKKLKLKWKLKKKFVLKKLLKKFLLVRAGRGLGLGAAVAGRKKRSFRFSDEDGSGITSGSSGSSSSSSLSPQSRSYGSSPSYSRHDESDGGSSSSSSFLDENSFSELQSIGLGQHELEMLRELPDNLQYEYKQELEELEGAASEEPKEADIMEYLSATNEFDTDHCIAKGICEVMSRGNRTGNRFENLLLEYYNEEPETRKDPGGTPAYVYDYAAFLGKSSRDERACASHFPKCPEPTDQLTNFMGEVFSSEMCDPPQRNEL